MRSKQLEIKNGSFIHISDCRTVKKMYTTVFSGVAYCFLLSPNEPRKTVFNVCTQIT